MGIKIFFTMVFFLFLQQAYGQLVFGERNMSFGDHIFPGINKSVNRSDANSAKYLITGLAGKEVHITFQLPSYLSSSSAKYLPIKFSSVDAGFHIDETGQTAATAFDPGEGVITTLGPEGKLHVWLGATVYPEIVQEGNFYSSDIIINVTYTTN